VVREHERRRCVAAPLPGPRQGDLDCGELTDVLSKRYSNHPGQWHRSDLATLRCGEHEPAAGQPFHLAADLHLTAQEVDHVDTEPEHLPLPQPEAGAHRDERPMTLGQTVPHRINGDGVPRVTSRVG
jgi:hypothetical protein